MDVQGKAPTSGWVRGGQTFFLFAEVFAEEPPGRLQDADVPALHAQTPTPKLLAAEAQRDCQVFSLARDNRATTKGLIAGNILNHD